MSLNTRMMCRASITALLLALAAPVAYATAEQPPASADTPATPPVPSKKPPLPTAAELMEKYPDLYKAVSEYVKAWEKQDYVAMNGYENWEGGDALESFRYMQTFTADFGMEDWRITKIQELENDQFLVFVLVKHNPPAELRPHVKEGVKVASTLNQYWKKVDGKYQHLFHLEKKWVMTPNASELPKVKEAAPKP